MGVSALQTRCRQVGELSLGECLKEPVVACLGNEEKKKKEKQTKGRKEEEKTSSGSSWVLRSGAARAACGSISRQHEERFLPAVRWRGWVRWPKLGKQNRRKRWTRPGAERRLSGAGKRTPLGISREGQHGAEDGPAGGLARRDGETRGAAPGHLGCALSWFLSLASFHALQV